jgi:SAM-dependent methyltransferase
MAMPVGEYVDALAAYRAALTRARPQDTLAMKLKKRLTGSPQVRYRVRLRMTHMLEPYSRRRARRIAAAGRQPLRLNLGSYTCRKPGFYNIDLAGIPSDLAWDVVRPLPFSPNSVDAICHDHVLEHLSLADGLAMTRDCLRVLHPGGRIRISVPDAEVAIRDYVSGHAIVAPTSLLQLQSLFYEWGHVTMYDKETLATLLAECGFSEIAVCGFQETAIEPCPDVSFREGTLYMGATKPGGHRSMPSAPTTSV